MTFAPHDPRGWAREHLRGCANVVLASYSEDTSRLNEAGIRHDVARAILHIAQLDRIAVAQFAIGQPHERRVAIFGDRVTRIP